MGGGRVGPTAFVVDAGKGADGAEDGGGCDLDLVDLLDELFDGDADVLAADDVEAESAGVAINGVFVFEIEGANDVGGAAPVHEGLFYFQNIGVMADFALATVAIEAGDGCASLGEDGAPSGGRGTAFGGHDWCISFD